VSQGLASVKRKRRTVAAQSDGVRERFSIGDTSNHGLATTGIETVICQNPNIGTVEVGLEVVEPKSTRKESSRRSGGDRELPNDEMRIAYDKVKFEMNELQNNTGRRVSPSDTDVMIAWRERVEIARAEAFGGLEERAMKLAELTGRVRERRYAGARVIEVAPIREVAANVIATDVQGRRNARAKGNKSRTDEDSEDRNGKRKQDGQVRKEREDQGEQNRSENSNERKKGKKCEENTQSIDTKVAKTNGQIKQGSTRTRQRVRTRRVRRVKKSPRAETQGKRVQVKV